MLFWCTPAFAQSSEQNFPTPITTNEISGSIRARELGDPRLTRFFYTFNGGQGDIFINVVTKDFDGDIDVFTSDNLRPLTKMVIFADGSINETGRLIYLRKDERLILRIEGRSRNDDAATYRIKFAGSFIALADKTEAASPTIERTNIDPASGVRVNSVGTIVEISPKEKPNPIVPIAVEKKADPVVPIAVESPLRKNESGERQKEEIKRPEFKTPVVVVTPSPNVATIFGENTKTDKTNVEPKPARKSKVVPAKKSPAKTTPLASVPAETADPLASIRLAIQMRGGEVIERPMSEVLKFSVDKGILTVITKDGKIKKYSIFDVAKVTIE